MEYTLLWIDYCDITDTLRQKAFDCSLTNWFWTFNQSTIVIWSPFLSFHHWGSGGRPTVPTRIERLSGSSLDLQVLSFFVAEAKAKSNAYLSKWKEKRKHMKISRIENESKFTVHQRKNSWNERDEEVCFELKKKIREITTGHKTSRLLMKKFRETAAVSF